MIDDMDTFSYDFMEKKKRRFTPFYYKRIGSYPLFIKQGLDPYLILVNPKGLATRSIGWLQKTRCNPKVVLTLIRYLFASIPVIN